MSAIWVLAITALLTGFFYWHESFPKPLRAMTAIFGVPTALASGISHYLHLGIPVYETPWAVILANLIAAILVVAIARRLFLRIKK